MAKKEFEMTPMTWALIAIALFLVWQGGFLGALITQCDNNEYETAQRLELFYTSNNHTIIDSADAVDTLNSTGQAVTLTKREVNNNINIIDAENESCTLLLANMKSTQINSTWVAIDASKGEDVLKTLTSFFWCSETDNYMLESTNASMYNTYFDAFTVCEQVEVPDTTPAPTTVDGILTGGDYIPPTTTPTPTVAAPASKANAIDWISEKLNIPRDKTPVVIAALIAVLFAAYWFLERGEKGLIKSKGRKRRK